LHGESAVAVLVLHSWSLLKLDDQGQFSTPDPDALMKFDALLGRLSSRVKFVTSRDIVELRSKGEIVVSETVPFIPKTQDSVVQVQLSDVTEPDTAKEMEYDPVCPICGTAKSLFKDAAIGNERHCSGCGSVERQRVFAQVYNDFIREEFDLAGMRVLIVAPAVSERRFLTAQGVTDLTSIDVRPDLKPDITADICAMPQVPSESFDAILASYILTMVYDLDAAIAEFARVLKNHGRVFTADPLRFGAPTVENSDPKEIARWYGEDAFWTYKVGSFRRLGDIDTISALSRHFVVKTFYGRDPVTRSKFVWHCGVKTNPIR
jgi:SAM-dependent methyltransferase